MKNSISLVMTTTVSMVLLCCNNGETLPIAPRNINDKAGTMVAKDTSRYEVSAQWEKYWYTGNAEITTYSLKQSRYGEIHNGNLTNIFVTEDFLKSAQVKPDEPEKAGSERIKILKLNQSVKFVTGIYPYSMMLSVFSATDINRYPHAIKITATSQEWCGQSFFQLNNRNGKLLVEQRSYFEKESDIDTVLKPVILEDELWTDIRTNPAALPAGEQSILPGALYLRLSHKAIAPVKAMFTRVIRDSLIVYSVNYPTLQRKLEITFLQKFPYTILSWQDAYPGMDGKVLTTIAVLNKTMMINYWTKHKNAERQLRVQLGLPENTQ